MNRTVFPTLEETLYLHTRLIEEFGGESGVRDLGLLESALARPRSGYYQSLSLQAAALMQSLASNHAFVDGNKRMAFALTAIFFQLNNYILRVDAKEAERFIVKDIIAAHAEVTLIAAWLEKYVSEI